VLKTQDIVILKQNCKLNNFIKTNNDKVKNMSILDITNLTDRPKQWITDKFNNAFEELEKELNIKIDETEKYNFIDEQIEWLEDEADETLGKDLLSLIDNYLVNLDYYAEVKEWYNNK